MKTITITIQVPDGAEVRIDAPQKKEVLGENENSLAGLARWGARWNHYIDQFCATHGIKATIPYALKRAALGREKITVYHGKDDFEEIKVEPYCSGMRLLDWKKAHDFNNLILRIATGEVPVKGIGNKSRAVLLGAINRE